MELDLPDTEGSGAAGRQHVPNAVADDRSHLDRHIEPIRGGEKQIGSGFAYRTYLGDDRRASRVNAELGENGLRSSCRLVMCSATPQGPSS